MPELGYRHAEPGHHARVMAVMDAWWGGRPMAAMLPRLFFAHFRPTSFVAECAGDLAGFLVGFRSQSFPDVAYVHFVGVHPAHRRGGVARELYRRFFDAARALGCREVQCVTSPVNRDSIAFHGRMGFTAIPGGGEADGVPVHVGYDGRGGDRVVFRRPL